ncbi:hypothetical protein DCC81_24420 [Chitinophaga parva]|uniref:Uncharacterized protein n=1 Tax=Chitinophaga parva TaxID=2169414 RepID=A0A2T7BBI3_9BACT|nr:hypothetical protein DCC81_24420 [Chitinophaga parva]
MDWVVDFGKAGSWETGSQGMVLEKPGRETGSKKPGRKKRVKKNRVEKTGSKKPKPENIKIIFNKLINSPSFC